MNQASIAVENKLCHKACCTRAVGDLSCLFSLLLGICTFMVSVMAIYTHGEVTRTFGINLYYGMYIVLFASLCTIWTAFLGMCGMSAKNRFFVIVLVAGSVLLIIILLIGLLLVLLFPYLAGDNVGAVMLKILKDNYGTLAAITTSWDYLQGYLLCCAVEDNGWSAWRDSKWFLDENSVLLDDTQTIPASNPAYRMVPKSCCYRKLDYLTRQLTDEYENLDQCQNWHYGPPKFTTGAHNDAIYYRGCLPTIQAYIKRFSFWIMLFGFCTLFFLITSTTIGCITLQQI
ncbi:tetraspanin 74f [Echinococcus multilocularis]|uniref:Tetraspanin 74f n=1 Tax=Echinococcus multilocularis TaxID=6211 RepID=A0A068Y5K1_ECHMU|nr:tetraspanin 74f [Echinococcus multilocularis]